jgi:hypothetical protein
MISIQRRPYLSIVVTSRNDNHGGSMIQRMRMFMTGLEQQAARHGLDAELILIDWNPPPDKPQLHEVLSSPLQKSPLVIRYITVTNEIHRRWRNWQKIPLYQMIAKNVGIRRAQGEFVLCTNVDLIYSDRLIEFLSRKKLDPRKMYRANRCDVPINVMDYSSVVEQLSYCEKNIIKRHGQNRVCTIHGLRNNLTRKLKRTLDKSGFYKNQVDTDACGDFTLLSKKTWEEIRGYPELGLYSIYLDGIVVNAAAAIGIMEEVLPPDHCSYHVEHHMGWMSISIMEKIKLMQDRPFLDYSTYCEAVRWMWMNRKPLTINDENWGCIKDALLEVCYHNQMITKGQFNA